MTDVLKKKPRMTCKKYCPVWNDIDEDCEIYGEHHFTPRTCPHYNIDILEKKKMAEMFNKIIEENYNTQNTKNEQLTEQWVNIYKSKKHGSYWTGAFCYKTKEEAVKDLADKENYLTTVNIEDMLNLQTQNAQLKEQINHLLKTQARQFVDNQKLQVKAEKAKDVINIDTARQIKQLKELLKEVKDYLPEFETPMDILAKIDEVLR
jgi:hypothetical protein